MKILIFGATGMVGQGVLREALLANDVAQVRAVGRAACGVEHPKLASVVHADMLNYAGVEDQLTGFDACFFCLGASAAGIDEETYTRINHDIPLAAARVLLQLNPSITFDYVSGAGTGRSAAMWAKVKARTEQELLALPFRAAFMFRPGVIQPLNGARSKTRLYRLLYTATAPLLSVARRLWPAHVLTTVDIGIAMLNTVRAGAPARILESPDIRRLAAR